MHITSAHDSSRSNDSLTFTYGQVALTTKNADGSPGESFSYDVAAARADASVPTPSVGASIGEVPTPAKYFLLIDGLNGGSTDEHHVGWFEIAGFDFDISTALAGGRATFSPVTVQLSLSDGLAGVLKDAALGTNVQSVRIEGVTGGATPAAVYDLSLGNVHITSAHDSSGPNDSLTFTYGQVALTTKNADGSPGESFSYDVAAARADASVPTPSVGASIGEVPTPAKYFLLIDGLNGGSTDEHHVGWFEIAGFDFDISTALAGGRATFSPVTAAAEPERWPGRRAQGCGPGHERSIGQDRRRHRRRDPRRRLRPVAWQCAHHERARQQRAQLQPDRLPSPMGRWR